MVVRKRNYSCDRIAIGASSHVSNGGHRVFQVVESEASVVCIALPWAILRNIDECNIFEDASVLEQLIFRKVKNEKKK